MLKAASENISQTVSIPHEIISIDNSLNRHSIFEAYNLGAMRSKFDYLCFMHEDVAFVTKDWGAIVIKILSDKGIGLIGVAGSLIKTKIPSTWETGDQASLVRLSIIQHFRDGRPPAHYAPPANNGEISDVVCLDGVWFCCRKEVWSQHRFDEAHYQGFHFYDLDFSMQIIRDFRICVVSNILLSHFSTGSMNRGWIENALVFSEKWKPFLPVSLHPLAGDTIKKVERDNCLHFVNVLIQNRYYGQCFAKYLWMLLFHYPDRVKSCFNMGLQIMRTYFPQVYVCCRNYYGYWSGK